MTAATLLPDLDGQADGVGNGRLGRCARARHLYKMSAQMFHRAKRRVTWPCVRIASAAIALVLVFDFAAAGGSYVYCASMRTVMSHPCCAQHGAEAAPEGAVLSNRATCCRNQEIGALDQAQPSGDRIQVASARMIWTNPAPLDRAWSSLAVAADRNSITRAPPRMLALARRVVLQI